MKNFWVARSAFLVVVLLFACVFGFDSPASAAWEFGIGTGLSRMSVDGDMGMNTRIAGPVKFKAELDPEDFGDAMESAFGFGGYASDGTWLIQYSYGALQLGGKDSKTLATGSSISAKLGMDVTGAELTVGYPVYKNPAVRILVDGGVRYTKHEISNSFFLLDPSGSMMASVHNRFDHDWTDAVIGTIIAVPFAEKFAWTTRLNAGFGGSEGTYLGQTGVAWRFAKHWSAGISAKYVAVDYENGSRGDNNWYMYDVDETTLGINVLFIF